MQKEVIYSIAKNLKEADPDYQFRLNVFEWNVGLNHQNPTQEQIEKLWMYMVIEAREIASKEHKNKEKPAANSLQAKVNALETITQQLQAAAVSPKKGDRKGNKGDKGGGGLKKGART